MTAELEREGLIRELIRKIQVLRKNAGFAVEQRIRASIVSEDEEIIAAVDEYADKIKADILATELCDNFDTDVVDETEINGHRFTIRLIQA
jgi:isoleucyl-tRNA synthetase